MARRFDLIVAESGTETHRVTERIRTGCPDVPFVMSNPDASDAFRPDRLTLNRGKRTLFIRRAPGGLVKPCPGTNPPYLCCRYTVINQTTQCPMDCAYCILQTYLDNPVVTIHPHIDETFGEVDRLLADQPGRLFRFGTGELGDSLVLDDLTGFAADFAVFFSEKRNALIELKTKSVQIEGLRDCKTRNVVVSWSLNPQTLIRSQESGAASLAKRLEAARACQERGFLLGFHFDPILWVDGWEKLYGDLVRRLLNEIDSTRIAWISMGSLRFPPALKDVIRRRFPKSSIASREMIRGLDGKMRYPKPVRLALYRLMYDRLKTHDPDLFVYFCMEPPDVWMKVTGEVPASNAELDFWFAQSLHHRFPEIEMDVPGREAYGDV